MPRILAIDYGLKRTGIAITDEMQIIASGLTTIASETAIVFLKNYTGDSTQLINQGNGTYIQTADGFIAQAGKSYFISITLQDGEKYASVPEKIIPFLFSELQPSKVFFKNHATASKMAKCCSIGTLQKKRG